VVPVLFWSPEMSSMMAAPPHTSSRVFSVVLASAHLRAHWHVDPNGLLSSATPPPVGPPPASRAPPELNSELP
jgi:hypothetical protein